MEKWEEEGFASEEAYNKYQQTIKDKEDKISKLSSQVDEKQKMIDNNRTKISDANDIKEERDKLKEEIGKLKEDLGKIKETPPIKPEDVGKQNEDRIAGLKPNEREKFQKEYEELNQDQKDMLNKPEGMKAYLDLQLKDGVIPSDNPFAVPKKAETIEEQVAKLFGKQEKKTAPAFPVRGAVSAEDLPTKVQNKQEKRELEVESARSLFV